MKGAGRNPRRPWTLGAPAAPVAAAMLAMLAPATAGAAQQTASSAASPPALTRAEVEAQPGYASALDHYQALKRMARPPAGVLPDWNGLWRNTSPVQFDPGYRYELRTTAPLKPEQAARYAQTVADLAKGVFADQLNDCLPTGYPRMLSEQRPFEFIVAPGQVWVTGEVMNETHRIYTDGRGHYPDDAAYPLWEGDSIGFWDGDTLIVHTKNLRAYASGYQRAGPPQSDRTSTVEQWRMIDPDNIVLQLTVYDPVNLTKPWRPAPRTYTRIKQRTWIEHYACGEAGKTLSKSVAGTPAILPSEPGFTDPGELQRHFTDPGDRRR